MRNDVKQAFKTSYRINGRIRSIIDSVNHDVCRKTGLELSGGKIARAFWDTLAKDTALRKKWVDCVCKKILADEVTNEYRKRAGENQRRNKESHI